jgi:hypothetical protein
VNVNTLEYEQAARLNMNDIASVEFEAHVPLFFDPYASNRATGSFILIDAISNATVGAGMIQHGAPERQELSGPEPELQEITQKSVSAQERYERHGHYPSTFLLENRSAVASKLERALFEQGFEVLLLGSDGESLNSMLETISTTQRIGAISIYSGEPLDAATKERLAGDVGPRLFELSRQSESASDEQLFQRGLALAHSLRIAKPQENREEAN